MLIESIRTALYGKKAYITAVIGVLTAIVAWLDGTLTTVTFVAAVWVAVQSGFLRAAISKAPSAPSPDQRF